MNYKRPLPSVFPHRLVYGLLAGLTIATMQLGLTRVGAARAAAVSNQDNFKSLGVAVSYGLAVVLLSILVLFIATALAGLRLWAIAAMAAAAGDIAGIVIIRMVGGSHDLIGGLSLVYFPAAAVSVSFVFSCWPVKRTKAASRDL